MQSLTFERTNGNIPRKLAGEDHISGIMFYMDTLPSGFTETERIKAISQIETAEKLGITADAEEWSIRLVHYQLSEIFRINPTISQCMKNRGKQIQINSINLLTINHLDWDDIFLYISKKSHLFAIFVT